MSNNIKCPHLYLLTVELIQPFFSFSTKYLKLLKQPRFPPNHWHPSWGSKYGCIRLSKGQAANCTHIFLSILKMLQQNKVHDRETVFFSRGEFSRGQIFILPHIIIFCRSFFHCFHYILINLVFFPYNLNFFA